MVQSSHRKHEMQKRKGSVETIDKQSPSVHRLEENARSERKRKRRMENEHHFERIRFH